MSGGTLLKVANLTKFYGKKLVLNSVNLDINEGEIFGLVGSSGAGKTTLLECIVGFNDFDQGDVLVSSGAQFGGFFTSSKKFKGMKKRFGFASQCPSFYSKLTVKENLEYFGSLYGMSKAMLRNNVDVIINLIGLHGEGSTLAGNLSGGMQKRLDIGCALIHGPRILILDEPTADLDPVSRKQMTELIKRINVQGTTVIIASHVFDEVEQLCNRISIVHGKTIRAVGNLESLKKDFNARNLETVFEAIIG